MITIYLLIFFKFRPVYTVTLPTSMKGDRLLQFFHQSGNTAFSEYL